MVSKNLESPKSITHTNTSSKTNETVFPRAFSGWKNVQTDHQTSKGQKSCAESCKRSWVVLIIKFGPVEITKLIWGKNWGMFFDKILFFLHVRIFVGKHFYKLSMRSKCGKIIEHLCLFFRKFWEVEFPETLEFHLMRFCRVDFWCWESMKSLLFVSFILVIFIFDKVNAWLNFLNDFSGELLLLNLYLIIFW